MTDKPEYEEPMVTISAAFLRDLAKAAHQSGNLWSGGKLHPGDFDHCPSMMCEDVRSVLPQTDIS